MVLENSYELYVLLKKMDLLKERPKMWWPNAGSFEVLIGAILTQQTKWEKVEKSLANLNNNAMVSLEALAAKKSSEIAPLIKPSGFYNTKAKWLVWLCKNIIEKFGNFENFQQDVSREWLLEQKGVGEETADSILCYACFRDEMVCDAYSARLLQSFGYEFETYGDIKEWLSAGILEYCVNFEEKNLNEMYADFHGMIVEYCKKNSRGKIVDILPLENLV